MPRSISPRQLVVNLAVLGLGVAIGALLAGQATARILFPRTVEHPTADAVVVLAGSPQDRLARGLELMAEGAAPVLVLSVGIDEPRGWAPVEHLCHAEHEFDVVCVVADANSTIGEAMAISRLAEEQGWQSLALVTSSYHLERATQYFGSCFDGAVHPVASQPARSSWPIVRHELLGAVHARTFSWTCDAPLGRELLLLSRFGP